MIHELLLVLCSYPGSLFMDSGLQVDVAVWRGQPSFPPSLHGPDPVPFLLLPPTGVPELPLFLHPSEAALLACVCHLGALYVRLHKFIEQSAKHTHPSFRPPPLCRCALAREGWRPTGALRGVTASLCLFAGAAGLPTATLPACFLHWAGCHAAALLAGAAGPGAEGEGRGGGGAWRKLDV